MNEAKRIGKKTLIESKSILQMFTKLRLKQVGRVDQTLHLNLQVNNYHVTNVQLAKSNSQWDYDTLAKIQLQDKLISKKIENQLIRVEESNKLVVKDSIDIAVKVVKTFEMALKHDCYHDIISRNDIENKITVAFLPISTSKNIVTCGIQKFNKVHVNINLRGYKTFYITRLLFHKIMTVDEYNQWVLDSKKWNQDPKLRKVIFNEIQKDLDKNSYSLLKDSDLIEPNVEFFTKELSLVKFKFTELEL